MSFIVKILCGCVVKEILTLAVGSFDFLALLGLNQIPFHSFRIDLEGLGRREHFFMWNLYLLSLVMKITLFVLRLESGPKEKKLE